MDVPRALLVVALALVAGAAALPVAAADVVVPVWACDPVEQTCACRQVRVDAGEVEAGRRCTAW